MVTKILITWGSGFIWKNFIKKVLSLKNNFEIYNLSPSHIKWTKHIYSEKNKIFNFSKLNIDFDYIIHTLALSSDYYCEKFELADKININFTKKIINFCNKQKKLRKFIFFSSITIYDSNNIPPVKENHKTNIFYGNYSFTKWIAEQYVNYICKINSIPFIVLRISNIYWPWQKYINSPFLIPWKIYEWLTSWSIKIRSLEPIRDFLYIDDAVSAIYKIMLSKCIGIYNLWSWEWTSIKNIVEKISELLELKYSVKI